MEGFPDQSFLHMSSVPQSQEQLVGSLIYFQWTTWEEGPRLHIPNSAVDRGGSGAHLEQREWTTGHNASLPFPPA